MNNDITKLLDLKDSNIEIKSIIVRGNVKEITLEKIPTAHYCPFCNFKMHSLGVYTRTANHPILQDGYVIKLIIKQRRWLCSLEGVLHRKGIPMVNPQEQIRYQILIQGSL